MRRSTFVASGGFRESYARPSIEDIELGYRLTDSGARIILDPAIQVQHLKRWTFWSMLKTDVLDRGIPWALLMLERRHAPDDLNLRTSQRLSTVLAWLLVASVMAAVGRQDWRLLFGALLSGALIVLLNLDFYRFLAKRRGLLFTSAAIPLHMLYHFYNGVSFVVAVFRHLFHRSGPVE